MRNSESAFSQSLSHDGVKCVTISHTLDNLQCFLSGLLTRIIKDFLCSGRDCFKDFSWILPGLPQSHGFLSPGHQIGHLEILDCYRTRQISVLYVYM